MSNLVNTKLMIQFFNDESGQDLVEYALLGALVAVACVSAVSGLANKINTTLNNIATAL